MNKIKEIQSEKKTNNDIINSKTELSNSLYFVKSSSNNQISQEDFYDEEEQSRLFKEAVENFRQGVEIDDQTYKLNKNKDFKSVTHELGTSPDILNCNTSMLPTNKERSCCWNCLKIILSEESIKHRFEEKIMKLKVVMKNINIFKLFSRLSVLTNVSKRTIIKFIRNVTNVHFEWKRVQVNISMNFGFVKKHA